MVPLPVAGREGTYVDLAKEYLERALKIRVAVLGPEHQSTVNTRKALAAIASDSTRLLRVLFKHNVHDVLSHVLRGFS